MVSEVSDFTNRDDLLSRMREGEDCEWDIIIVGGGITGAGVLREAVRLGYRALLLEQKDFSWGTSSRSSKMIHGGLRYLGSGDLKLTRHSLTERERLLKEAPGLIDRMDFYFGLRKGVFPGRWPFSILLWIYDRIAGVKSFGYCNAEALKQKFEGLEGDDLTGACFYTDGITDDSRLVMRVLQEAIHHGGKVLSYTRVEKLLIEEGDVQGLVLQDVEKSGSADITLRAPVVINATGAWADKLRNHVNNEKRVRPLRGSHLVIPRARLPISGVFSFFHPQDKRSVFLWSWEGATAIGTTDLDHTPDLGVEASITEEEVEYLLNGVNKQFPKKEISRADVISTWSGVRPVIGSERSKDPSKERRDHAVWSDQGLVTVSGGKLTTFRLIALDALAAAESRLPPPVKTGGDEVFSPPGLIPEELVPGDHAWGRRMIGRYGAAAGDLLREAPQEEHQRIDGTHFCLAECRWAIGHEAVMHLDDLLLRRTRLGLLLENGGEQLFAELQRLFSDVAGWDGERWEREVSRYRDIWKRFYSLPETGPVDGNG
ncbi:MAG: glycerol-3-phosphate dehydrogenase [Halieaceae bacterium]|jgi:glycerol-3-phosphate dehydrogenase